MRVTKEALEAGIAVCRPGNTVADIGKAIEQYVHSRGSYGIVRELCGRGRSRGARRPIRFNYYDRSLEAWELKPGAVIAIQP